MRRADPPARSDRHADNLTDAPLSYLRRLAWGMLAMALAVVLLGTLLGSALSVLVVTIFGAVSGGGFGGGGSWLLRLSMIANAVFLPLLWPLGVYLVASRRPVYDGRVPDPVLDGRLFRRCVQVAGGVLPAAVLFTIGAAFSGGGVLSVALLVVAGLCLLAMFPLLVPVAIYLASLADWAGDTSLGGRLRACAWAICVFGVLDVFAFALAAMPMGISALGNIAAAALTFLVIVGTAGVLISVVQLALGCRWAVNNSINRMQRDARVAERRQRHAGEMHARSMGAAVPRQPEPEPEPVLNEPLCARCGYSLGGLPVRGACPECGLLYELKLGDRVWVPPPRVGPEPADDTPIPLSDLGAGGPHGSIGGVPAFEAPLPLSASDDDPPGMEHLDPDAPPKAPGQTPGKPSISHTPRSITARRRGRRDDSADTGPDEGGTGASLDWGH